MFESLNVIIAPASVWRTTTPLSYTLELPFYLLEWGHFVALEKYYTARENSNRYLLFYTVSGQGHICYNGKDYTLAPNTVAIINCNAPHQYENLSKEPWNFYWFHYNGSAADIYYKLYNEKDLYLHEIFPTGQEAEYIYKITACSDQYDLKKDLKVSQWISDLMTLCVISKHQKTQQESSVTTQKLKAAIQYMSEHLTDKISVSDISQSVFLSQYHFLRLFKKEIGIPPYEYLIHLRINRAKELLISTDTPLDEIAAQSGFSDSKNLIYNFKRIVKSTPNEYRKDSALL